jgi:hypothetical protein
MKASASTSFLRLPRHARSFSFKSTSFVATSGDLPAEWPQHPNASYGLSFLESGVLRRRFLLTPRRGRHVRSGSKPVLTTLKRDFRNTPESRHLQGQRMYRRGGARRDAVGEFGRDALALVTLSVPLVSATDRPIEIGSARSSP